MTNSDILQAKKMLQALLKSEGLVEWVGGYVYGATSNGDPFVILYPASEHLKEKVCRVYPHQFKKLPAFIATDNIVGDTDGNPSKDKAQRAGIYHECRPFQIVMHLGKETQMGREKRFSDVLYISQKPQAPPPSQQTQTPPENGRGAPPAGESHVTDWDRQAAKSMKVLTTPEKVANAREAICGTWHPAAVGRYLTALNRYESVLLDQVNSGISKREAHGPAVAAAKRAYAEAVPG